MAAGFDITERHGKVEVTGFTAAEVADALETYSKVREVQADHLGATKEQLVHALMLTHVPLTPPAALRQAQRLAARRAALLATPTYTFDTLSQLRGERANSTRTWFSRQRKAGRVVSVTDAISPPTGGRLTLVPAFQFTETGQVRPELAGVLRPLLDAGLDGWTVWHWLTSPTNWLSGQVPEKVAATNPERAAAAARRFAARPAA